MKSRRYEDATWEFPKIEGGGAPSSCNESPTKGLHIRALDLLKLPHFKPCWRLPRHPKVLPGTLSDPAITGSGQ